MTDPDGYYKLLNIPPQSDIRAVKRAYYKLQKEYHPDNSTRANEIKKIQNAEERAKKMKELEAFCAKINEAANFLSDEENKKNYDQGIGKDGPKIDASNIFDFFTGGRSRRQRKMEDTVFQVDIELRDAYVGLKKKFKVSRSIVCKGCDGKGADREEMCDSCGGRGSIPTQVFGGFILGQTKCRSCHGAKTMPVGDKCKKCNGKMSLKEEKIFEINIEKGVTNQETIVYEGMGDEGKGCLAGDVVFVIAIKENKKWRRVGMDLIGQCKIDLYTALAGGKILFENIDGRKLEVVIEKIKNFKNVLVVKKEGFGGKGDLFIDVDYEIPREIDLKKLEFVFKKPEEINEKCDTRVKAFYGLLPEEVEENEGSGNIFRNFFFN